MNKNSLLIIDPTLKSLEGHSYNYDIAVARAACNYFDEVVIFADKTFPLSQAIYEKFECELNLIPLDKLKKIANSIFNLRRVFSKKSDVPKVRAGNASVLAEVPSFFLQFGEKLRAWDLLQSIHKILVKNQRKKTDIFIQHTRISDLLAAEKIAKKYKNLRFHLVLRHSPKHISNSFETSEEFAKRLNRLCANTENIFKFYTDSEQLTIEYRQIFSQGNQFQTLPIPVLFANEVTKSKQATNEIRVSMLGAARVEKGFDNLPEIITAIPQKIGNKNINLAVQTSKDSADPRVQKRTLWLKEYASKNPEIKVLEGPVAEEAYFAWFKKTDILLAPYISPKYAASTSGVFVEALYFIVPIITTKNTWMAQKIEEAAENNLRIGEVIENFAEIGDKLQIIVTDLAKYQYDIKIYLAKWKEFNNAETIVKMLSE